MQELDLMGLCLITLEYQKAPGRGIHYYMYQTIHRNYPFRTENNRYKLNREKNNKLSMYEDDI